jgi:predicted amidohydrolase
MKGGHLIDPKNRVNARRDVTIKDGIVAAVAQSNDASQSFEDH